MASWISMAAKAATMEKMITLTILPPPSSSSLPPKKSENLAQLASMVIAPARDAATVDMRISRCSTCESSWASTPSSSCLLRIRRIPVVTATALCSGFLPVAKALGLSFSMTYTLGIGIDAR